MAPVHRGRRGPARPPGLDGALLPGEFGVRYVAGAYNVADFKWALPVITSFANRTMRRSGHPFILDLIGTYP